MAVKHKIVEVVDPSPDTRLHFILRVLQNLNAQNNIGNLREMCEKIVYSLGNVACPSKTEDYVKFIDNLNTIQKYLRELCSPKDMILIMLTTLYKAISDPHKMPQPAMSIVLQLINVEAIPNAVECILQDDSESSLEEAFNTLCDWLTRWTWTANLGPSVLCFMQGLANRQHYDILVDVTLKYVDKLFMILILPDPRDTVGPVVLHMLSSTQNSAEVFRKIIPHAPNVLQCLQKEDSESSRRYLEEIGALFSQHLTRFPEIETILQRHLEPYQLSRSHKQRLACKSWVDSSGTIISTRFSSGKVGLNNLGNTCYMNSVLQALFMTKLFRNDILMKSGDSMPLFTKLQMLFVLLQHSRRSTLSPNEILSLARPPGFQPGHQHDSSEFLGYLLDVLHEQEKVMGVSATAVGTSERTDAQSQPPTIVQRSFGGRALTISRCGDCDTASTRADNFRELQLSFPSNCDNQSVQTLLDYYLQLEKLCGDNQYHCDTCQRLTDGERVTRVEEPPPRLVLTLKHFSYNPTLQQRTKLLKHVQLDEYINLGEFNYELYAVVVHFGSTLDSGHYYTFARDDMTWYKFNDGVVTQTTPEELCSLKPPGTPYILFYSRHDCVEPEALPRSSLSARLEVALEKELNAMPVKTYATRQQQQHRRNDDPPPPGCGGGAFVNSDSNSAVKLEKPETESARCDYVYFVLELYILFRPSFFNTIFTSFV